MLERVYRSWIGLLPMYLLTIWWPLEMRRNAHHRRHIDKRGTFAFDRALVLGFLPVQVTILSLIAQARGVTGFTALALLVACGIVVPFLAFNWLIGFATFQHHTHPRATHAGGGGSSQLGRPRRRLGGSNLLSAPPS